MTRQGDKRLFIRDDELEAAWKLFTPLLQHIETTRMARVREAAARVRARRAACSLGGRAALPHAPPASAQVPELYPYGSRGPIGAHYLGAKHNVRWGDSSQ